MPIEIIDKIKPKNNGSFPLVDAADVQMPNGERLTEALAEKPKPSTIDLSRLDPDAENKGVITETLTDGTAKETKLTYDDAGNITEIEDADGHKTTLVWPSK
jgi:YD repeat-containing protein